MPSKFVTQLAHLNPGETNGYSLSLIFIHMIYLLPKVILCLDQSNYKQRYMSKILSNISFNAILILLQHSPGVRFSQHCLVPLSFHLCI